MGNHCTYKGLTIPEIDNLLEPYAEKTYKKLLDKYEFISKLITWIKYL